MLILSRRDVEAVLDVQSCMKVMADALTGLVRGTYEQPPRGKFTPEHSNARMGLMPAFRKEGRRLFGLKSVMVVPENRTRGLDTHQGAVLLHDAEDGRLIALVDATAVTEIRTAAVSALATRLLARPDSGTVAILGAGTQARAHIAAMRDVLPGAEILIWGRSGAQATALAEAVGAHACASVTQATSDADVICTVTSASLPVLEPMHVASGCHINAVGASTPVTREISGELVARATRFVDSRVQATAECGELRLAMHEGLLDPTDSPAEIGEVLLGLRPGRMDAREITLFKSLGLAVEDLAAADFAMREAVRRGIGVTVDW